MDADEARRLLRVHHRAILATSRRDGRPQLSPILVAVDSDGHAVVSTRETAVKVHNLRARPYASLCVFTDRFFGQWLQVEGATTILSLPDAMPGLVAYYRATAGEHPDWAEYRAAMERERRCLIRIGIDRVGPTISG